MMSFSQKIDRYILTLLLTWYGVIWAVWLFDETLAFNMKIIFGVINVLMLSALVRVLKFGYSFPKIMDFSSFFSMIIWFFFSTYRDMYEPGYPIITKLVYVLIDILSLMFLVDSFVNFCCSFINEKFFMRMKVLNGIIRIGLVALFSFLTFEIFKGTK